MWVEPRCLYGPPVLRVWFPARQVASPVTPSLFSSFLLPSTAAMLTSSVSSLQGDSHRSGGNAGVTDSKQISQWKQLESLPTVLLLQVPVGRAIIKRLLQSRGDVGRPRPGATLSITSSLFPCFCFFSLAELLHTHPHVLSSRRWPLIYAHTHSYSTIIRQWKLLINPNCLFSPRRCWVRIRRRR